jgi:hypothetical protein
MEENTDSGNVEDDIITDSAEAPIPMETSTLTNKHHSYVANSDPQVKNKFNIDLECCNYLREMNKQLEKEEEYNEKTRKTSRKARLVIFKKELLNDQLIKMYKTVTNNLIKINLNNLNELSLDDFRDYFKLLQTHTELSKLLFNLTSPIELLSINRNFIYKVLTQKCEFEEPNASNFDF